MKQNKVSEHKPILVRTFWYIEIQTDKCKRDLKMNLVEKLNFEVKY